MIVVWSRRLVCLGLLALVVWILAVWAPRSASGDLTPTSDDPSATTAPPATHAATPVALVDGHDVHWWAHRARRNAAAARAARRSLAHSPNVTEAIGLACTVYGNCATLWRRARCESHLYRYAQNASGASGLFQFLPSTWRSTPFARFSIFSAYSNALAAGWMIGPAHRGGEWVCQ